MRQHPFQPAFTAIVIVLLGLLPMACAEEPRTEAPAGAAGAESAGAPGPGAGENLEHGETGAVGPVEVRLTEYAIQMPQEIPAGTTAFVIHNQGNVEHNFEIEGQGIEEKLPVPLAPGATGSLQVTLPPGEYKVYCPVADHESEGMTATLIVG